MADDKDTEAIAEIVGEDGKLLDALAGPVPALFEQCLRLYEAMSEIATIAPIRPDSDETGLVYEGFLTRLITDGLHLSNPYYTKLTQRLKAMDCIRQLKRGGSTAKSKWLLVQSPTFEHFNDVAAQKTTRPAGWRDSVDQQIRDLSERLTRAGL
jgi:hypothetical protein